MLWFSHKHRVDELRSDGGRTRLRLLGVLLPWPKTERVEGQLWHLIAMAASGILLLADVPHVQVRVFCV